MAEVAGHQGGAQGEGMGGDQEIHRANRVAGLLQFMSNAAIVRRAGDAVVIEDLKRREELVNGGDLRFIVAAVVCPEFQLRNGDGGQIHYVALRLGRSAPRDDGEGFVSARSLASRGFEAPKHGDDRICVQHEEHGRLVPRFERGLNALAAHEPVGQLLDALEKDVPRVLGQDEKPIGRPFQANRVRLNPKFLWEPNRLAPTALEDSGNRHGSISRIVVAIIWYTPFCTAVKAIREKGAE